MSNMLPAAAAGRFTFPGTTLSVNRMGYGAMQLAGPHVFGEPKDPAECAAVLHEVIKMGVDHIDTSDFYGPHVTNRIIRETLHPYPSNLTLVSKIGGRRDDKGAWLLQFDEAFLRKSVEDNLKNLKLDKMAVVNLRLEGPQTDIAAPMKVMRKMQEEGMLSHIGISTVDAKQVQIARDIAPIVCVQNHYNLVHRADDALIDELAAAGIAYVPYFPLGGFTPLQTDELKKVAEEEGRAVQTVALAWLLQRSPNILLIPGTSKRSHLKDNIDAAALKLSPEHLKRLNGIAALAK